MVNLHRVSIESAVLQLVPFDTAKRFRALPLFRKDHTLIVALADPLNVVAIDTLQQITGLIIEVVTAPEPDILNCLELHHSIGGSVEESIDQILAEESDEPKRALLDALKAGDISENDAPVIRLVDQIIARAVQNRASDIH